MYAGVFGFGFFGFVVLVVVLLVARECYLFIKMKIDDWNMRVYARLLRHEMMLRLAMEDRNAFNAPEDPSANRYGDIFFIEPGSVEANRIRDQLEKDEKDLPSYDEVMRMCSLTTPTAAAAGLPVPPSPLGEPGPIGIAALPAPPYSETDPHAPSAGGVTVIAMETVEPSTSRAAQIPLSTGSGPPAPLPTTTV
ncbi:uncharacterized protein LOC122612321 isoform X8 [Drosophila teissieri]|uniref:uncharacterized protein LOC122612321 isoform X8 n=1 Tax=Drosophila teissieri TaxID=7243 RepID=UPI001CBA28B6|nr:uncharacterized protein LOC122612321 isoform X8 [Drosophila teissieri]